MAMSDCEKCWDTPCICGWEYRNMSKSARIELACVILGVPVGAITFEPWVSEDHPLKGEK